MTPQQKEAFVRLVVDLQPTDFHHGDCVGADDEAATIADANGAYVVCHPPIENKLRAFNPCSLNVRPAKTHFARNRDIVNETDLLIATPCEDKQQAFGGTWRTITYAMKVGKPVKVIWPDGRVEDFERLSR